MRQKTRPNRNDLDYKRVIKKITPVGDLPVEVKVVLYGKSGTGKTTLASTFPKPILYIDVRERGTDSIRNMKKINVLRAETWEDVDKLYWYIKSGDHPYKTVVWDTVSQIQALAIKEVLKKAGKNPNTKVGWGTLKRAQWGEVATTLQEEIMRWRDLPYNIVFIAHDRIFTPGEEDEENDEQIEPSVGPRLMPSVASVMNGCVGVIGNTFIRERTRKKLVKGKKVSVNETQYCLRIGPHAYYTTKIRKPKNIKIPVAIPDPSFEDLMAYVHGEESER